MDRNIPLKLWLLVSLIFIINSCNFDLRHPEDNFNTIELNSINDLDGVYKIYGIDKAIKSDNYRKGYLNKSLEYKMIIQNGELIYSYMPEIDSSLEFTGMASTNQWNRLSNFNKYSVNFHVKDAFSHAGYFMRNNDTLMLLFQYTKDEYGEKWYMYREEPLDATD